MSLVKMCGKNKKQQYKPFRIPGRKERKQAAEPQILQKNSHKFKDTSDDTLFYEIDYNSCGIEGVGKFVLRSQKITPPEKDEIRTLFYSMRDIARQQRRTLSNQSFFDRKVQQENAFIFYKQGLFMKDFTDEYPDRAPFSSYFPFYQMMGYEQLRTYFTWRTNVRNGVVRETSLSYAFVYVYELLSNIGVNSPEDGLNKLMWFWNAFRVYHNTIDRYIIRWLKDYHIYYELPKSFQVFIEENQLTQYYPDIAGADDDFGLFCSVSKYDIRKSGFFTDEYHSLIIDCFTFVLARIRQVFLAHDVSLESIVFHPTKKLSVWRPFKDALFYPWITQPDRRVVLSKNEIYICRENQWLFSTAITAESGKQLIGYIIKKMESVLRAAVKYKYKLSADIKSVSHELVEQLESSGISLETTIQNAVMEFYRETTKTVVTVDPAALARIRRETLSTQEKLIVEEPGEPYLPIRNSVTSPPPAEAFSSTQAADGENPVLDIWEHLKNALSETEKRALLTASLEQADLKAFADENEVMLEVLIDAINEKAMDCIGDNLFDEELTIYDDYKEKIKEMVG